MIVSVWWDDRIWYILCWRRLSDPWDVDVPLRVDRARLIPMGLTFEFFGGPRDGEVLAGGSGCLQCGEIQQLCRQPHDVMIGRRINCVTLYSETISETCSDSAIKDFISQGCRFPNHTYEVFRLCFDGAEIRVELRHIGPATGGRECRACPLRELRFPD